jgi:hypothetical protein
MTVGRFAGNWMLEKSGMLDELAAAEAVVLLPVAAVELGFAVLLVPLLHAGKSMPTASTAAAAIHSLRFCIGDLPPDHNLYTHSRKPEPPG